MMYSFDWSDVAFGSKKELKALNATFIAASRELSKKRFIELVKTYLPQGNILLGIAKEQFIDGFEDQAQFRALSSGTIEQTIAKVNMAAPKYKIYTLSYFQKETSYIIEKLKPKHAVFINGSWRTSFHMTPVYYTLVNSKIPYTLLSPFIGETEARQYEERTEQQLHKLPSIGSLHTDAGMLDVAAQSATHSYDHTFQTGAALGKKSGKKYKLIATAYNKVVPYQTYALHHGALRERYFSPANDLNYYDTVHAEVELLVHAQKQKLSLNDMTLFINLMPCPTCARMLTETDIEQIVYQLDHSDGYAIRLLTAAGKRVQRLA